MKKSEIKPALEALKEIKMPKIEDKDLRNELIENHFALLDAGKKLDAAIEAKKTVFLESYKEEENEMSELQNKINAAADREEAREIAKEINAHRDYRAALRLYNEDLERLLKEEIDGLKPIDRVKFMEAIEKQDYKLSWVEALYPLFVLT